MAGNPPELDFDLDLDDLNALAESAAKKADQPGEAPEPDRVPEQPEPEPVPEKWSWRFPFDGRPLSEIAKIAGGVFLVSAVFAWIMVTFVFTDETAKEATLELPRDRMESVMMELPIGKIRHESVSKKTGKGPQLVFVVEIDASIVVKGNASQLVRMEKQLRAHHHRIEEAIDEAVRSSTPADLIEPGLWTLRSQVRDRINAFLDEPLIKEVIFSHYRAFHTPIKS